MKMKKKLDLEGLKIESFVTSYSEKESETVKGGRTLESVCVVCPIGKPTDTLDNFCTINPRPTFYPTGPCNPGCD
mgnify:CR=1 FL=1